MNDAIETICKSLHDWWETTENESVKEQWRLSVKEALSKANIKKVIAELKEAIKPFADEPQHYSESMSDEDYVDQCFTLAQCKKAKMAYEMSKTLTEE